MLNEQREVLMQDGFNVSCDVISQISSALEEREALLRRCGVNEWFESSSYTQDVINKMGIIWESARHRQKKGKSHRRS